MTEVALYPGDCLDILPTIESESVDAVITDPIYPCIKRDYGHITVEQWWALIVEGVIPEVRRILKPTGSAVFILQPNSEHVGQMRGWLWEFMAWVCREWNMVQDVWWWNFAAIPSVHASMYGLTRPSLKACVWAGVPTCYRNQEDILWGESWWTWTRRQSDRASGIADKRVSSPSGHSVKLRGRHEAAERRGGVTPFNVLPFDNDGEIKRGGVHSASTPLKLADWWTRYIVPPGGTVLDMFVGSGTMMLAAIQNGCNGIGIDNVPKYIDIAQQRVDRLQSEIIQLELAL